MTKATRINEITSTEKLLDFIRKKSNVPSPSPECSEDIPRSVPHPSKKIVTFSSRRKALSFKAVTVGIYIGRDYLWLAKTAKGADGEQILVDKRQRAIPPSLKRSSVEFINLLRVELDSFCERQKTLQLWVMMSSLGVEVGHIRIPKVPKKQIENVVYWTVKKETPFNEKEDLFDFQVLGEVNDQGITKWSVMYYRAPKLIVEEMKRNFSNAGWPLTGLSIAPFALQNIFRTGSLAGDGGPVAHLFIGNDFSRIDIFSEGNLVMTRDIKAGINSMLECLIDGTCHLDDTDHKVGAGQQSDIALERARNTLLRLSPDAPPLQEDAASYGLKEEEIWQSILPAFERLVRQMERTFEYFTITLGNEKVKKIYVSLAMNVCPRIGQYVGEQLNVECDIFDPLQRQPFLSHDDKISYSCDSERMALALAWGIALSDNLHTPNFLFTFKDKEKESAVKRINVAIFIVFVVSVSLCTGFYAYQLRAIDQKRQVFLQLKRQMSLSGIPINREQISMMLSAVKEDMASANLYSQRYQGLAIFSELSQLTPPGIHLIKVKANLGPPAVLPADAAPIKASEDVSKKVEIEGFVSGEKQALNNYLASYVIKLKNSPLFQQIKVQKTNEETFSDVAMLRFVLTMSLEGL